MAPQVPKGHFLLVTVVIHSITAVNFNTALTKIRTFLVEPVVVVLVHGPRHAEVGELDGARRVDEAVPGETGVTLISICRQKNVFREGEVVCLSHTHLQATSRWTYLSSAR